MKTLFVKEQEAPRAWYVIDATDKSLGRIAVKAADMLRGKHKVTYSPHQEIGDYVVIINAEKALITGNKAKDKMYHHHTGFIGGLRSVNYTTLLAKHPEDPLLLAIKGMLPKGRLGRKLLTNVKVYAGDTHPHAAQNPQLVEV